MRLHLHVITVSDRVSQGVAEDNSGPAIINYITKTSPCFQTSFSDGIFITSTVVPDETLQIQAAITEVTNKRLMINNNNKKNDNDTCLIITTGGTGFAARDVTPEAVSPLIKRPAPSIMHAILNYSLGTKKVASAWVSRGVAGVLAGNSAMIITLPGSSKAVVECLEAVSESGLVHALKLMVQADDAHPVATPSNNTSSSQVSSGVNLTHIPADRSRKSDFPMISVDQALKLIIDNTPFSFETNNIEERYVNNSSAIGHILAEDAIATFPHPPFRASIKDGYAVITSDGVGEFPVAASFCAGADIDPNFVLKPGQLCRVNTGGPIPEGADAVIQVEDTELVEKTADGKDEARIRINIASQKVGQDIRPIGCDVETGAVVVKKGTEITTAEVALLNSIGVTKVKVYRKPRIAVLSTGDELIDASSNNSSQQKQVPPTGKIYDSNRPMLLDAAATYTNQVIDLGIAKDVHSETKAALDKGFQSADIIISTGGVSMGEVDWVKKCLIDSGAEIHFGRVSMKPGKPTTFASKQGKLFFALPGNPVSAMVCFYLFVVPALRKWSGMFEYHLPITMAKTLTELKPDPQRSEYHRCKLSFDDKTASLVAGSTGSQASHRLMSMAGANGLLIFEPGSKPIPAGSLTRVMIIGPIGH